VLVALFAFLVDDKKKATTTTTKKKNLFNGTFRILSEFLTTTIAATALGRNAQ
jgi:hypothetical protein